jgi:hypothetical protein
MSNAAVLGRPTHGEGTDGWVELDETLDAPFSQPATDDLIELEPPFVFPSQQAMRFGERTYTERQAEAISLAVRTRSSLRVAPLPLDD